MTFNGIFMAHGYDLGVGSIWRREEAKVDVNEKEEEDGSDDDDNVDDDDDDDDGDVVGCVLN